MFFFSYFLSLSLSHTHTNTQPPTRPTWPTSGRAPAPDPGRSGRSGRPGPGRPEPEGLPVPGPGRSGWSVRLVSLANIRVFSNARYQGVQGSNPGKGNNYLFLIKRNYEFKFEL